MPEVKVEVIDEVRERLEALLHDRARKLPHTRHADLRLDVAEGSAAVAENGNEKSSSRDYGVSLGVRVLAGDGAVAPGYFGQELGERDVRDLEKVVTSAIRHAHARALANAQAKATVRPRFGALGASLMDAALAPVAIARETVKPGWEIDPRSVRLGEINALALDISRRMKGLSPKLVYNVATASTAVVRRLFISTEGAHIDQWEPLTAGFVFAVAMGAEGQSELYDFMGHQRGWEFLGRGCQEELVMFPPYPEFALKLAQDVIELSDAPALQATETPEVVVTDPHFNALLCHEVVGHPTELDRALKHETAYAGRSWLLQDMDETMLGKQIASSKVSAFSDPTLPALGYYKYDDEGTPGRRQMHIDEGQFVGFTNNRQTAHLMGMEPNGHAKATDASLVPLIRMSNTIFERGTDDPQRIVKEVERGWYLAGHRIPSISESRENFRISAMKVYEIRNGELGRLYRNGGITSDTKEFFMSIDAVGTDLRVFSIPNCGKGQPMQSKRMGNGGPTLRGRARLTGA
jgi:TldD protein